MIRRLLFFTLTISYCAAQSPFFSTEQNYTPLNADPQWVQMMYAPNANLQQVMMAYEDYYKHHSFTKNNHTQYLKRWVRNESHAWYPLTGDQDILVPFFVNEKKYELRSQLIARGNRTAGWTSVGPYDFDKDASGRSYAAGAAHVYTVVQSLSNPDVLFAGTATAGIWKTIDRGLNWIPCTRGMMVDLVRSLAIDPTDPNTVMAAMMNSVYKSTDGGTSWALTGDATFQAISMSVTDLQYDPLNHNIAYCCSSTGFYRTTDGGTTWTTIAAGIWQEMEFHPTDSNIVYAVKQVSNKTEFYKSTDHGISFSIRTPGWPDPANQTGAAENKRVEIASTIAAPDYVYALATGVADSGSGLYGIYVSHDKGDNWTFQCCGTGPGGIPNDSNNMNLMGWSDVGSDDGGQYYYDLAFDVSSTHADSLFVCAVNLWESGDTGVNFVCPSKWSHSYKPNYVHADIHDIHYDNGEIWIACDGGIFYSNDNGANFNRRQFGIEGTDFWGFASHLADDGVMIGGCYHNGTLLRDGNTYTNGWISTDGGDGVRGFANPGKPREVFSDYNRKTLSGDRTISPITSSYDKKPNTTFYYLGGQSELVWDPHCYGTVYSGNGTSLWKSIDDGNSYTLVHDFGTSNSVTSIEVAWTNPDYLYVCTFGSYWGVDKKVWRSIDGGASWLNITPSIAQMGTSAFPAWDISVSSSDENVLWLARINQTTGSGSNDGYKVWVSTDAGINWTNLTTSTLDGEFLTNIFHQRGTDGGVWLGTRRAVYYRNNSMSDWQLFNPGLPLLTESVKLQPFYRGGKIINGTTRSVYESDFYEHSSPQAMISVDKTVSHCLRDTFFFADNSVIFASGASWSWSFPGGNPSTSTAMNPAVTYAAPGTYNVSLTINDIYGTSSQTLNNFITVLQECDADTIPGNALSLDGASHATVGALNLYSDHVTISCWAKPIGTQEDWAGIVFSRAGNTLAGFSVTKTNEFRYHWNGDHWQFQSGLYLDSAKWNYLAMVITPDSATLYVNGIPSTHVTHLDPENFDGDLKIGDDDYGGRDFKGLIDEVCIWNRSLSADEIRLQRHLTKNPSTDPSIKAYYQFNLASGIEEPDRARNHHAYLSTTATRAVSTAPLGGGVSSMMNIQNPGTFGFGNTGLVSDFSPPVCNGKMVATRINLTPDAIPSANHSRSYWVINNYGVDSIFNQPDRLRLNKIGNITLADALNPSTFKLYMRGENADGNSWGTFTDAGDSAFSGPDRDVVFTSGNFLFTSAQIIVTNEGGSSLVGYSEIPSSGIQFFPNPAQSSAVIYFSSPVFSVRLFSVKGEDLGETKIETDHIKLPSLAAGIYFLKINNEPRMEKFVVAD